METLFTFTFFLQIVKEENIKKYSRTNKCQQTKANRLISYPNSYSKSASRPSFETPAVKIALRVLDILPFFFS